MVSPPRVKPKLRGVFHEFGFYASIAFGLPLVLTADPWQGAGGCDRVLELPRRLPASLRHRL
jgi:hypothetical protein